MGETSKKLFEKIPDEKCWIFTAKILLTLSVLRGVKTVMPILGKGEGIISAVWGLEKFQEIIDKVMAEGAKRFFPRIKSAFDIPIENALEAAKLTIVTGKLQMGPKFTAEVVEAEKRSAILRTTKCGWMERYKEFEIDPELIVCPTAHQLWIGEGLKAINPKITYRLTKTMPWGDPYCEEIFEFEEEKE